MHTFTSTVSCADMNFPFPLHGGHSDLPILDCTTEDVRTRRLVVTYLAPESDGPSPQIAHQADCR